MQHVAAQRLRNAAVVVIVCALVKRVHQGVTVTGIGVR